jgi:hypothetical protein
MKNLLAKLLSQIYKRLDELPKKLRVLEEGGIKVSSVLIAADLLTWKSGEVEEAENMVLEFALQYEKLTDEQKSDLLKIAKSAYREYVQEMLKRVKEPGKLRMQIELLHNDLEGKVEVDQIQDAMKLVERFNEEAKPRGRQMKIDTVNFSLIQATAWNNQQADAYDI